MTTGKLTLSSKHPGNFVDEIDCTTGPDGEKWPEPICCPGRAAHVYGAGSPIHMAIQNAQADEFRRWRDKVHDLETELAATKRRLARTGAALWLAIGWWCLTAVYVWVW